MKAPAPRHSLKKTFIAVLGATAASLAASPAAAQLYVDRAPGETAEPLISFAFDSDGVDQESIAFMPDAPAFQRPAVNGVAADQIRFTTNRMAASAAAGAFEADRQPVSRLTLDGAEARSAETHQAALIATAQQTVLIPAAGDEPARLIIRYARARYTLTAPTALALQPALPHAAASTTVVQSAAQDRNAEENVDRMASVDPIRLSAWTAAISR